MTARGQHLSQFAIDAVAVGQLDGALRSTAEQHLAGCGACRDRLEATRADDAAVAAAVASAPPAWLEARPVGGPALRDRRRRWLGASGLGLGLAAAATAVLVAGRAADPAPPDGVRTPGKTGGGGGGGRATSAKGPTLSVVAHVQRAASGAVLELEEDVAVEPGDRVQLSYTAPEAGFVAVVGRDQAGHVTLYYPAGGTASAPAAAGTGIPLPFSIELDAAPGDEIVQVIWCRDPVPLVPLANGPAPPPGPPARCAAAELRLVRSSP
ncbi:MAG TPA: DUF4384 domain-containing protein [Kofleriaceae bacterium]|nr:DUF4384 domain-containing protein [Kofleriaceae bacterium]